MKCLKLVVGAFAILVFIVITAPKASAVVGPLIENFENIDDWTYSETDTYGTLQGGVTSDWNTEGDNSCRLEKVASDYAGAADLCQIRREIDLEDIGYIMFDARLGGNIINSLCKAQVYIGETKAWERSFATLTEYLSQSINVSSYTGTENVIFRLYLGINLNDDENLSFYIDNLRDASPWELELRWEETYGLVEDGSGDTENKFENGVTVTFFFDDNSVQKFTMTRNPENFSADPNIDKIRVDVTYDNYWRTRIIPPGEENATVMILVDNTEDLDQYEFTLRDLTGLFGIEHEGQLWISRYIDNQLRVHEDYWDAEGTVTAFLVYGGEYSLRLVTTDREKTIGRIVADGILIKDITISEFTLPNPQELWDDVAWSVWWDDENLMVSYQDNMSKTDNATVNIYDENDNQVHTDTFSTNEWTLTWDNANENNHYSVELNLNHQTHGSIVSVIVLSPTWAPPTEDEDGIPGIGQLGDLPFAWGSGIAAFIALVVAKTFGARHAGFSVMTMGMFLLTLGPIMGFFTAEVAALVAFLMVMGAIMMLTKKGD